MVGDWNLWPNTPLMRQLSACSGNNSLFLYEINEGINFRINIGFSYLRSEIWPLCCQRNRPNDKCNGSQFQPVWGQINPGFTSSSDVIQATRKSRPRTCQHETLLCITKGNKIWRNKPRSWITRPEDRSRKEPFQPPHPISAVLRIGGAEFIMCRSCVITYIDVDGVKIMST